LCGSIPIITDVITTLRWSGEMPGTAAGMPDFGAAERSFLFEPRHGEARQAGTSFVSQAVTGRQAVYEASPPGL